MPLARIITKSADDSLELSMQLRSRGFRVETVDPDQVPATPADLEVRLEECAPEDVLTQAVVVKESEDLWVFVAPGALDERSRPMRTISLIPQVVEFQATVSALAANAATNKTTPRVEIPVVEVRVPLLEPEDDPILSELAARQSVVQDAPAKIVTMFVTPPAAIEKPIASRMEEVAPVPPVVTAKVEAPAPRVVEPIRRLAPPKPAVSEIPIVPERVEPIVLMPALEKPQTRVSSKSYKIAFQAGPKLWRTAAVSFALIVLAGLLATVVAVKPPLPPIHKTNTTAIPPVLFPSAQAATADSSSHPTAQPAASPKSSKTLHAKADPKIVGKPLGQRTAAGKHHVSDDSIIAKDTVIFYDRKPAPREAKVVTPRASGLKRYSDTN